MPFGKSKNAIPGGGCAKQDGEVKKKASGSQRKSMEQKCREQTGPWVLPLLPLWTEILAWDRTGL